MPTQTNGFRVLSDIFRAHDFVGLTVLEDTVLMDARLVGECIFSNDGLVRLYHKSGERRHHPGSLGQQLGINACVKPEVGTAHVQRHDHFFQGCIAGSLPDSIDRAFDLAGSSLNTGQRIPDREAQVIVAMG